MPTRQDKLFTLIAAVLAGFVGYQETSAKR